MGVIPGIEFNTFSITARCARTALVGDGNQTLVSLQPPRDAVANAGSLTQLVGRPLRSPEGIAHGATF